MFISWFKGNRTCSIVDTPGIGDMRQDEYAQIMMKYLPNALAFVFVIDVANCGGFQHDRVIYDFVLLTALLMETI